MVNTCEVCKIEFESIKAAKTCSPKCRVTLARLRVTESSNVTLAAPNVTHDVTFSFTIKQRPGSKKDDKNWSIEKDKVRTEKYWYDIPLSAIPVMKQGYPKMPDTINGRQYFLWWKNEFKTTEDGQPIIYNPFPVRDNVTYVQAGQESRRWGA